MSRDFCHCLSLFKFSLAHFESRAKQQVRQTADRHVEQLFCEGRKLRSPRQRAGSLASATCHVQTAAKSQSQRSEAERHITQPLHSIRRDGSDTHRGGTLRLQSASIKTLRFILASGYWSSKQIHHSE